MKDLKEKSNYKLVVPKGTSQLDMFRYSNDSPYKEIWKEKMEPYADGYPSADDLVSKMKDDHFSVVYTDSYLIENNESYLACDVVDTGPNIRTMQLAWAIPKNSQFYEVFSYHIAKLKEIGAVQRYATSYKQSHKICPDYSGKPLPVGQCFTAFIVLVFGICSGIIWLTLENVSPQTWMKHLCSPKRQNEQSLTSNDKIEVGMRVLKKNNLFTTAENVETERQDILSRLSRSELIKIIMEQDRKV